MASTYLSRSVSSNGNRQKFTISLWVKKSEINSGTTKYLFTQGSDSNNNFAMYFDGTNTFGVWDYGSGYNGRLATNRIFRDVNSWYHIVVRVDTTLATAGDRMRLYVNGVQETSFSTSTNFSQNFNTHVNQSGNAVRLGYYTTGSGYFNGLMSHVHLCDGYSYGPDSFGSTDSTTGEWKINTDPSVSYGTNGFWWLKDNANTTDNSPNSNTFTVAAGTLTPTKDNPSNVFATWNPLSTNTTLSTGNTESELGSPGSGYHTGSSTLAMTSGKFYMECKVNVQDDYPALGICRPSSPHATKLGNNWLGDDANSYGFYVGTGSNFYHNNSGSSIGTTLATDDVLGMALDLDSTQNTLKLYKNGSLISTQNIIDSDDGWMFAYTHVNGKANAVCKANFGNGYFKTTAVSSAGTNASNNGIFEYDVPAGYTALSTKGLNL